MDVTAVVESEVKIFVAGLGDGEEGDPWIWRRGGGGSEGGGAVVWGVEEVFAGAGVLGVGVFAHGFFGGEMVWAWFWSMWMTGVC